MFQEKAWNSGDLVGDYNRNPQPGWLLAPARPGIGISFRTYGHPQAGRQGISMTANLGSTTNRVTCQMSLSTARQCVCGCHHGGQAVNRWRHELCASPLWAVFMALVNQQAALSGNPSVGFLAPTVYALAKTASYTNYFHDTTTGDNTWDQSPISISLPFPFRLRIFAPVWERPTGKR